MRKRKFFRRHKRYIGEYCFSRPNADSLNSDYGKWEWVQDIHRFIGFIGTFELWRKGSVWTFVAKNKEGQSIEFRGKNSDTLVREHSSKCMVFLCSPYYHRGMNE